MNRFWYLIIIAIDIGLTNFHQLWANIPGEIGDDLQWHYWKVGVSARICLLPIVMLFGKKLDKWGELVVINYFSFSLLDLYQTMQDKNIGNFTSELIAFILINLIAIPIWKKKM